ncbi:MAG TPA: TlpA disulfide reductase family protein [Bryobacteraceae bacterium]|nr:TlpA disulfide reductase family protein [Bryobacteraceae bacterium]
MKRLLVTLGLAAHTLGANTLWDATINVNGASVPFRMEFSGSGKGFRAWFFNGDEKTISASGESTADTVIAQFPQYNSKLEAKAHDGSLEGTYTRDGKVYPVRAVVHRAPAPAGNVPNIAGSWVIETGSATGEKAWPMIVRQTGAEITGAILRVDGDTGTLTGRYQNGSFTFSHFSGARPVVFSLTPAADGTLNVVQNEKQKFVAVRETVAREKGLPAPDDPMKHTTMRDPNVPLRFEFPDLEGRMVSSADPRFKGKVVIVAVGGSWCPNCHDEAPMLESLYRKYRSQGLEIIDLSFEEEDQLKNPTRLRAFRAEYGLNYPVLLAGEPSQLAEKLPQAQNLDTFPATFFVGRDGLVKAIHAGFAGRATGVFHQQLLEEIEALVKRLLAEK